MATEGEQESSSAFVTRGGRAIGSHSRLSVHTVFIARENIFFLREWMEYHSQIGVDHFYLYDNTGSTTPKRDGHSIEIDGCNKYGVDISAISSHLSDGDVERELERIVDRFPGQATLIRWRPKNARGEVEYGYNRAVEHCVANYGADTDWLCSIDVDEFLFSPNGEPLEDFLRDMDASGVTRVVISQKKFLDRFLGCVPNRPPYVLPIEQCIEGIYDAGWAPKILVRTSAFASVSSQHAIEVGSGKTHSDRSGARLRFNHYNVNPDQLHWMKEFFHLDEEPRLDAKDTGMRRYIDALRARCPEHEQICFQPSESSIELPAWFVGVSNRRIVRACISETFDIDGPVRKNELHKAVRPLLPLVEDHLPRALREFSARQRMETLATNTSLLEHALQAVQQLQSRGIRVAVIKGGALLESAYDDEMDLRPMTDVDLLVDRDGFEQATQELVASGWRTASDRMRSIRMHFDHANHFFRAGGSLDLHSRLLPEGDFRNGEETTLDRAVETTIRGRRCLIIEPVDLFAHTCIHGIASLARTPDPRWIVDGARLHRRHDIDWMAAQSRTEPAGVGFLLGRALRLMRRVGVDIPPQAIARFPTEPRNERERAVEVWRDGGEEATGPNNWLRRARAVALCTQPPGEQELDIPRAIALAPSYAKYVLNRPTLAALPRAAYKRLRKKRAAKG